MQRNLILAIVLSVVVLLVYNLIFSRQFTPTPTPTPPPEQVEPSPWEEEAPQPEKILPSPEEEEEIILENDYLKVALTSYGGRVKSWYLKKEKKELIGEGAYALGVNLSLLEGKRIDLSQESFEVQRENERKIVFSWEDEEENLKLSKSFELPKQGYDVFVSIGIENFSLGSGYELTWQGGIGDEYREEERIAFFEGKLQEENKEGVRRDYGRGIKWMGLRQKRDLLVILASLEWPRGGVFRSDFWGFEDNNPQSRWVLYAGPQNYSELRSLNKRIKEINGQDYQLKKALNLSIWGQLSKGLLDILYFFYSFTHNYGAAIILLTLLIYGILFPLTFKQFTSMHKMSIIQPEVQAVQKKFKGDPKRMQIEMMKIYKKHKVNPMSGCFPLLIQMPIIFILYRALLNFNFSENPSFLWIRNLGEPNIPLLLALGATMFLQQRITQKTQAQSAGQQQGLAKMMQFFPIFIIVMLWSLPSAVMLYWFTSTLFSIFQQFLIRRKISLPQPTKT